MSFKENCHSFDSVCFKIIYTLFFMAYNNNIMLQKVKIVHVRYKYLKNNIPNRKITVFV